MNSIVLETVNNEDYAMDIYSKLESQRILFINGLIDDNIASEICASLMLKDQESKTDEVTIFLNSEGGDIRAVLMIYDFMQLIECPIKVVCSGLTEFESLILLAAADTRLITKNSTICASQLYHEGIMYSDLSDAKSNLDQVKKDNEYLVSILAKATKKSPSQIKKDFERRRYMTPSEAKKYGFVDKIIESAKDTKPPQKKQDVQATAAKKSTKKSNKKGS